MTWVCTAYGEDMHGVGVYGVKTMKRDQSVNGHGKRTNRLFKPFMLNAINIKKR
jgi:hypothetical protein